MADDNTVIVASTAPMAIQISDLPEDDAQPGSLVNPRVVLINGARHEQAINGVGITRDVPADLWEAWIAKHPHYEDFMSLLTDDEVRDRANMTTQFGVDPGLEAAAADADNVALAAEGAGEQPPARYSAQTGMPLGPMSQQSDPATGRAATPPDPNAEAGVYPPGYEPVKT
jgi:hypothetical protein